MVTSLFVPAWMTSIAPPEASVRLDRFLLEKKHYNRATRSPSFPGGVFSTSAGYFGRSCSRPFPTPANSPPVCYGYGRELIRRFSHSTQPAFSAQQIFVFNTRERHYLRPPTIEYRTPESPSCFPSSRNPSTPSMVPPMANKKTSPSPIRKSRSSVKN